MTTSKPSYDSVKKVSDEITKQRIQLFTDKLRKEVLQLCQAGKWSDLKGKEIPATSIDGCLRRAADAGRLGDINMNRAAFELWKRLEEAGAKVTRHDTCQIVPCPDIESKIARAVEKDVK